MIIDVVDTKNAKVGDVEVDESVFGARVKSWLFYEVVKAQMANRRAGTQSTKTASEVRGTGKKPRLVAFQRYQDRRDPIHIGRATRQRCLRYAKRFYGRDISLVIRPISIGSRQSWYR